MTIGTGRSAAAAEATYRGVSGPRLGREISTGAAGVSSGVAAGEHDEGDDAGDKAEEPGRP
jgi:hypothetical protein